MVDLRKTLFCNIAWMKNYSGITPDDKPYSGAKYVSDYNDAYEKYNFLSYDDGYQYGFVETKHPNGTVNLETTYKKFILSNFGEEFKDSDYASGILVIFFARNPADMKFYIVGYYKDADVFRTRQYAHNKTIDKDIQYNLRCKTEDAVIIEVDKRLPLNLPNDVQLFYRQLFFYPLSSRNADICRNIVENVIKYNETKSSEYLQLVHQSWIIPSNPKYYDLDAALNELTSGLWYSQRVKDISVGDYLYIYVAAPISAYRYKCVVTRSNVPLSQIDINEDRKYYKFSSLIGGADIYMRIKLVARFNASLNDVIENVPHVSAAPQSQRRLMDNYLLFLEKKVNESSSGNSLADLDDETSKEDTYYGDFSSTPKEPVIRNGVKHYPRNDKVREIALSDSNNRCAINGCKHVLFISRSGKPYLEAHHIIPINAQGEFQNNIDIPENVVCLCPSCHREIHNGKEAKNKIIELFEQRKDKLSEQGINVDVEKLLSFYN